MRLANSPVYSGLQGVYHGKDPTVEFPVATIDLANSHISQSAKFLLRQQESLGLFSETSQSVQADSLSQLFDNRLAMEAVRKDLELRTKFLQASDLMDEISHRSKILDIEQQNVVESGKG